MWVAGSCGVVTRPSYPASSSPVVSFTSDIWSSSQLAGFLRGHFHFSHQNLGAEGPHAFPIPLKLTSWLHMWICSISMNTPHFVRVGGRRETIGQELTKLESIPGSLLPHTTPTGSNHMHFQKISLHWLSFFAIIMFIIYVLCVGFRKAQEMITQDARGR